MVYDITTRKQLALAAGAIADQIAQAPFAIILLEGDLGAGKTTFSQELGATLGVDEEILSPTYSLLRTYQGHHAIINHLDLYRVTSRAELDVAGVTDLLLRGEGIFLIEWPRYLEDIIPLCPVVLRCALELAADEKRSLTVQ